VVGSKAIRPGRERVLEIARADLAQVAVLSLADRSGLDADSGPISSAWAGRETAPTRSRRPRAQRSGQKRACKHAPTDAGRGETAIVDFHFNAWARYDDWQQDPQGAKAGKPELGLPLFSAEHGGRPFVLEGGGTTSRMRHAPDHRGVLPRSPNAGPQPGDGTRGVRETLRRLSGREERPLARPGHYSATIPTGARQRRPAGSSTPDGSVPLRLPGPKDVTTAAGGELRAAGGDAAWRRARRSSRAVAHAGAPCYWRDYACPASYANFYVATRRGAGAGRSTPGDREAMASLGELFPDRPWSASTRMDLVLGFGTVHCLDAAAARGEVRWPTHVNRHVGWHWRSPVLRRQARARCPCHPSATSFTGWVALGGLKREPDANRSGQVSGAPKRTSYLPAGSAKPSPAPPSAPAPGSGRP